MAVDLQTDPPLEAFKEKNMRYIDYACLEELNASNFLDTKPYPWMAPSLILRAEAFEALAESFPPISSFSKSFGGKRAYGQESHDRYVLPYRAGLEIPNHWSAFIDELNGEEYRNFISGLFNLSNYAYTFTFMWHQTPRGCSVSPHCDIESVVGRNLYYFNRPQEWNNDWGGHTLILDDEGRMDRKTNPSIDDFHRVIQAECVGNTCLFFGRTPHAWHAVKKLTQPEGIFRKMFQVTLLSRRVLLGNVLRHPLRYLKNKLSN